MYYQKNETFPDGFLWGAGTSSFQVEGAANKYGKGISVIDKIPNNPDITDFEIASDHYHKMKEDVKLMSELGLKVYRFSIAWTRILPNGNGEMNKEGIEFYHRLIDELHKYDIEPLVTMYHFDYPQTLVDQYGGWIDRKSIDDYHSYASLLFDEYGEKVKYWLTINEQDHVVRIPTRLGLYNDDQDELLRLGFQANHHMCVATAKVIETFRERGYDGKIGPAVSYSMIHPASSSPEDMLAYKDAMLIKNNYLLDIHCHGTYSLPFRKYLEERSFMPVIEEGDMELIRHNPPTMIGVNYYYSETVEAFPVSEDYPFGYRKKALLPKAESGIFKVVENKKLEATDWGWEIDPVGLRLTMRELNDRYGLPIIITENGMGAYDKLVEGEVNDDYRIDYLSKHIAELKKALNDGVTILGYSSWTFMDVVSGRNGMSKRYGFVYVNREDFDLKDMRRIKKKSFYWYKNVIQSNGEEL